MPHAAGLYIFRQNNLREETNSLTFPYCVKLNVYTFDSGGYYRNQNLLGEYLLPTPFTDASYHVAVPVLHWCRFLRTNYMPVELKTVRVGL